VGRYDPFGKPSANDRYLRFAAVPYSAAPKAIHPLSEKSRVLASAPVEREERAYLPRFR
jgi:hypothetical protein